MYTNNDFTINGIRYTHAYMLRALCNRVIRDYGYRDARQRYIGTQFSTFVKANLAETAVQYYPTCLQGMIKSVIGNPNIDLDAFSSYLSYRVALHLSEGMAEHDQLLAAYSDYEKLFYLLITTSVRNRADILNRFLHFRSVYIPDIGLVTNSFDLKDAILTVRNYRLVSRWTD